MTWSAHPQEARGLFYVLQPGAVFERRVNLASATYPLAEVPYDGAGTGAYTDVQVGMTVLFGSSAGAYDLGWSYIRKAPTSSVLYVGYSSQGSHRGEITATDNAYITVLDTYEVWRRPMRLTNEGNWYRDYDIDGTTDPPPIAHVGDLGGLGRIGLTSGGVLTVSLDSSGSVVTKPAAAISARLWDVGDGTITVGADTDAAITVTFPPGKRWVKLTVTDDAGSTQVRRYLVVALDPTAPGTVLFNRLRLRRRAQGQTLTIDLQERLDPADYLPGTAAMLLMRERRGASATYVQRFAGWLDAESSSSQATPTLVETSVTMTAVDVAGRLAQLKALPTTVANEATQTDWLTMVSANLNRYLHRHLAFETTALALADLTLSGSSAYPFMSFSTTGGTMYDVCDKLARAFARRLTCDSKGRLRVKLDPLRQNSGDRTATVQRHVGEADWSIIKWSPNRRPTVGALRAQNAVISSGYASVLVTPFPDVFSVAPGEVAGQGMGESTGERGLVTTFTESHERLGHDYARANAPDSEFGIDLAHGVDADIEPADMTWVTVTAGVTRSYRGPTLATARGLPTTIDITVDAETGVSTQKLTWERETVGTIGARDPLPNMSQYPTTTPQISVRPRATQSGNTLGRTIQRMGLVTSAGYLLLTDDWQTPGQAGGPTWRGTQLSIDGTIMGMVQMPLTPGEILFVTTAGGGDDSVYRLTDPSGAATLTALLSLGAAVPSTAYRSIEAPLNADHAVIGTFYVNNGSFPGVWWTRTLDGGDNWLTETQVTAHYESSAGEGNGMPMFVSSVNPGEALIGAFTTTGSPATAKWHSLTSNYGTKTQISSPASYDPLNNILGAITKSFANGEVDTYYYRRDLAIGQANSGVYRLTGSTVTKVLDAVRPMYQRGLHVCYVDANRVVVTAADTLRGVTSGDVFLSADRGGAWDEITPAFGGVEQVEFAGDDGGVVFGWGTKLGAWIDGAWDEKTGNLASAYPSFGRVIRMFGVG